MLNDSTVGDPPENSAPDANSGSANRAAWQNFWHSGRSSGKSGAGAALPVVLDLAERLQPVWQTQFSRLQSESLVASDGLVVELACGARPALAPMLKSGGVDPDRVILHDGSEAALVEVAAAHPETRTLCTDLAELDLPADSAALVVSQFGLEYGSEQALSEVQRIMQPDGLLLAVVHKSAGAIDQVSAASKAVVADFLASGVLAAAPELFRAAFDHHAGRLDDAGYLAVDARFAPKLDEARQALQDHSQAKLKSPALQTLAAILQDMGQLHGQFGEYRLEDLLGWLAGWEAELEHYAARLSSMLAAAVDESTLAARLQDWQPVTPGAERFVPLQDADGQPFAWLISARWSD